MKPLHRRIVLFLLTIVTACLCAAGGVIYVTRKQTAANWYDLTARGAKCHEQGDDRHAALYLEEAVSLSERMHYKDAVLGQVLNTLGQVYHSQARYDEAASTLRRALNLRTKAFGKNSFEAALTLRDLAMVGADLGHYKDALQMLIEAMGDAKAAKGPNHPYAAMFQVDLGMIYLNMREYEKSESALRAGISIARRRNETKTHACATCTLSYLCSLEGKFPRAESYARSAVPLCDAAFGKTHINSIGARSNLATALLGEKRSAEARQVLEPTLRCSVRLLGATHRDTALLQTLLAQAMYRLHDYPNAEVLAKKGLATDRRLLGPLHRESVAAFLGVVEVLMSQGKTLEAQALIERQLKDAEKIGGPISAPLAGTLEYYAQFLRRIHRYSDATAAEARAKKIRQERHRQNLPDPTALPAFPVASLFSIGSPTNA